MEFIEPNLINTSTQLSVSNNTSTAENVINPNTVIQYFTDGDDSDLTTTSFTVNFDATTAVSRIGLLEMNWKSFTVFYNGATASTFSMTSTAATTTSDFSTNSETSMFITASQVNCTSVTIDIKSTQVANSEKVLGHLIVSDLLYEFERVPSAKNYKPKINPKQVVHKLSDGGVRIQYLTQKSSVEIKYSYISQDFRDNLRTIYDRTDSFIFVAFPTTTSWDKIAFDCVWPGTFDFYRYSDNAQGTGFTGKIKLQETSI